MFEYIQPVGQAKPTGPGSHAVKVNGWVHISGQTARDESGAVVGKGDIRAQTVQALTNLEKIMVAAGGSLDNIVSLVIYLPDVRQYRPIVVEERLRIFGDHRPASTVVGASLANPDLLIEIEGVGYVPEKK